MRITLLIIQWAFVLCLPLLLLATNIRWVVNSLWVYEYGFNKYNVSLTTGLADFELRKTAKQLMDYFNSRRDTAQVIVLKEGKEVELFTEREIIHLQDVKNLVQFGYHFQISLLTLIGVFVLLLVVIGRKKGWQVLAKSFLWGSALTFSLLIILALMAIFRFDQLFLFFHWISFPNEYWILDPEQHYLIRMFPQGFFQDAALFIFAVTLIEAFLLGGIALGGLKLYRW